MKLPFLSSQQKPENRWLTLDIEDYSLTYGVGAERELGPHITHCGVQEFIEEWEEGLRDFLHSFRQTHILPSRATISLPASVSKARIFKQKVLRGEGSPVIRRAEAREIANNVIQIAGKKIAFEIAEETGIPPVEWMFLRLAVIGMSLDGYDVAQLEGNNAQELEFTVLATLCLRSAFTATESIFREVDIVVDRVVDEIEAIHAFGQDGIYVHVGDERTRMLLIQGGLVKDMVYINGQEKREIERITNEWERPSSIFTYGRGALNSRHVPLFPEHILAMFPKEMIQQTHYTPLAFLCYAVS